MTLARAHPREKHAPTPVPIAPEIKHRWSPRAFDSRPVPDEELRLLLEAARWAPSSYNEQPWRFIVARAEDDTEFEKLLGCLKEANRAWAEDAPVLMLTVAKRNFEKTGDENRHALHDVGLAMGNLVNQASHMGLYVHQMAGIDPDRARSAYDIPDDFEIVAGVAIGYLGEPEQLDDPDRRQSEVTERSRRPLHELVFQQAWGRPAEAIAHRHD